MAAGRIKNTIRALALIITLAVLLTGCGTGGFPAPTEAPEAQASKAPTAAPTAEPTEEPTPEPTEEPYEDRVIREAVEAMSAEEKLGMLVMFGFSGTDKMDAEFAAIAEKYKVGGFILGSGNVVKEDEDGGFERAGRLIESIESDDPLTVPRLFAADVEGGDVVRFRFTPGIPSARKLSGKSTDEVRGLFAKVGAALRGCGVNLDLAPVCDVAEDPFETLLGSRIFSADPATAAEYCAAVSDGLHEGGCASCLKHFPGHGAVSGDSHSSTPVTQKSAEELYGYDIEAFRLALSCGPDCVMAAHVLYPALDEGDVASVSAIILSSILRGELGFDGVIISDDMLMRGLTDACPLDAAPLKFILAGGDIVLCGADAEAQETVMQGLYKAYELNILTHERLDRSVTRILRMKYERGIWVPD